MTAQTHGDEPTKEACSSQGEKRSVPCELFRHDATQDGMRGRSRAETGDDGSDRLNSQHRAAAVRREVVIVWL